MMRDATGSLGVIANVTDTYFQLTLTVSYPAGHFTAIVAHSVRVYMKLFEK